jgi:hypothetical protein
MKRSSKNDGSKHQIPTSNIQRTSNNRSENNQKSGQQPLLYTDVAEMASVLNDGQSSNGDRKHPFDLEERTAKFGEAIVRFSRKLPRNSTNNRLIDQLVGCGTGIGANYCEANEGVSKKRLPEHHRSVCQRSERNQIFSENDCCVRT